MQRDLSVRRLRFGASGHLMIRIVVIKGHCFQIQVALSSCPRRAIRFVGLELDLIEHLS
jgi:hypothetical protein